jgi:hypothetical protein
MPKNKQDDGFEDVNSEDEQEQEETLATPGVIDKYQQAGKIANSTFLTFRGIRSRDRQVRRWRFHLRALRLR